MSGYRIVVNEQSGKYRVEKRGMLGWQFVMDAAGTDYLTFDSREAAQQHVCSARQLRVGPQHHRRWRVVDTCCESFSQG